MKLATALDRLYLLDDDGRIWFRGPHAWEEIHGPVDAMGEQIPLVDLSTIFIDEHEDSFTYHRFGLYVLTADGRLFYQDPFLLADWSQQELPK